MKKGILTILALNTALLAPLSSRAQSTEELLGAIFGGVGGAAVCSQFGKGNGKVALTAACAIGGAILGSEIGRSLSRQDQDNYRRGMNEAMGAPIGRRVEWRGDKHSGHCETVRTGYYRQQTSIQCREVRSVVTDFQGRVIAQQVETSCYRQDQWIRVEEREVFYSADREEVREEPRIERRDPRIAPRDENYGRRNDEGYSRRDQDRRHDESGYEGDDDGFVEQDGNYEQRDQGQRREHGGHLRPISRDYLEIYVRNMRSHYADAARLGVVYDLRDFLRDNRMSISDRQMTKILNELETRSGRQEAVDLLSDSVR